MYFETEQYLRTALEFTQVLEHEERDELSSAALFNLALCQRTLGDLENATQSFLQYREEYVGDERALDVSLQLAQLHRINGRSAEAISEYTDALHQGVDSSLKAEIHYEVGSLHEDSGEMDAALMAYAAAMQSSDKKNTFRLSAVARCAAIYEENEQYKKALEAYRDLARNADDPELSAAAEARAAQLETFAR
jgi:tetratricopeptide (TPR) repeat protein